MLSTQIPVESRYFLLFSSSSSSFFSSDYAYAAPGLLVEAQSEIKSTVKSNRIGQGAKEDSEGTVDRV